MLFFKLLKWQRVVWEGCLLGERFTLEFMATG